MLQRLLGVSIEVKTVVADVVPLIDGDPVEFVRRLKQADGGDIALVGGVSLVRQLFLAGVLDTLTLRRWEAPSSLCTVTPPPPTA